MAENFQDNVAYGGSSLAISGDALIVGASNTNATSKTVFFNNNSTSGALVWGPSANRVISLPDASGVLALTSQGILSLSAGAAQITSGQVIFSNLNGVSFGANGQTVTASMATSLTAVNVSAGTTSNNLSAVVFSNSNNVSFGLNGSTVTATISVPAQTVQTEGRYAIGNTVGQSSSSTFDARTLSISGMGIASVGYSNNALIISVPSAGGNINVSAGTTSNNLAAITFSNANNVSFGLNASTLTASIATSLTAINVSGGTTSNNLSAITFSNANNVSFGLNGSTLTGSVATSLTGVNLSAGTTSNNLSAFVFSNSNGVSFGLNGSTVTGSIAAQTVQTEGRYAIGNTVGQSSSSTFDARTLSISGLGGVSVGYSNNALIISGGAAGGSVNFSAGTTSNNLTAITFSNSNGVSFGLNGSTITGSVATSLTNINISAGTTSSNLSAVTFSNSNGLAFGLNGGTITGSYTVPTQSVQTEGRYAIGNTVGQSSSSTFDARTLSISGMGGVSVGYSNNALIISGGAGGGVNFSAGTTSNNLAAVTFSNSNNVSFGLNGSTITGSIATSLTGVNLSAGTTSNNLSAFVFSNSNGVSFGLNGSTVTGSVATSLTNINISAGTTSGNLSAIVFSNSNGVSFGLNGSTVTASGAGGAGQTTAGLYALGNTTQNSSTTLALNSLSFNGLGAMTVGYSNSSIQLSAPATSSLVGSNIVSISVNASTISIIGPQFSGVNIVSISQNASTISVIGPVITGVGGIKVSQNASTISISGPSYNEFEPQALSNQLGSAFGQGTWYFQPFALPANISGGRINRLVAASNTANMFQATNGASFSSGTIGSRSVSFSYANTLALYSLGTGTNSTRLESIWSNTFSVGVAQSVSVSTNGATTIAVTNAVTVSYIASIDSAGVYSTASTSGSTNRTSASGAMDISGVSGATTNMSNLFTGSFVMPVGFNTTIPPGNYWLAQAYSVKSTTAGTTVNASSVWSVVSYTVMSGTSANTGFRLWGQTTAISNSNINPGRGAYTAISASPMATVAFSDIRSVGSDAAQYFNFVNSTI